MGTRKDRVHRNTQTQQPPPSQVNTGTQCVPDEKEGRSRGWMWGWGVKNTPLGGALELRSLTERVGSPCGGSCLSSQVIAPLLLPQQLLGEVGGCLPLWNHLESGLWVAERLGQNHTVLG